MAKVEFAGGVEVDIATAGDVASVGQKVVDLGALLSKTRHQQRIRTSKAILPTSTTVATFIELAGPPNGKVWDVRSVTVLPTSGPFGAQLAWPVALYAVAGNPTPADVRDVATAIPATFSYGRGSQTVAWPEVIIVGILAGALSQVVVNLAAWQFDTDYVGYDEVLL